MDLPDSYSGYSFHSYDTKPLPTDSLSPSDILKFRDEAFLKYYKNPMYLDMIETKFGLPTRAGIEDMTKIKLKRKILGD